MNTNWQVKSVGEIVAHLPAAASLFKSKRIDFCCGGQRLLGDVLREQSLDVDEICSQLDRSLAAQAEHRASAAFTAMSAHDLSDYIQGQHHAYLREVLPRISEVFSKVLKAHGANHLSLFQVHGLFGKLRTDLEQHLVKEEVLLFPQLDADVSEQTAQLAAEIIAEHEAAGAVLRQIRTLTNDYTAPSDACRTYRYLLEQLEELEGDLFQHIHLENNILLKDVQRVNF